MNPKALGAYPRGVLDRKENDPRHRREPEPLAQLAELVVGAYPDPLCFDSAESFTRYHHDDLVDMDLETLDRERLRARMRWAYDPAASQWLRERLAALDREADRRRAAR